MSEKELNDFQHDHDHDCGDDCQCDDEMDTIVLTLDDDTELECGVLGIFEVEDVEYIALAPMDDEQVLLYKYVEDEDDPEEFQILNIDSDEEFELVSEAFYALFTDEFYDEDEEFEED